MKKSKYNNCKYKVIVGARWGLKVGGTCPFFAFEIYSDTLLSGKNFHP